MKKEKNIFIVFVLNLFFSITECIGGFFIGSTAIISDALHDFGDALSIGLSYAFERKSKKSPDEKYTFGYGRFSILGGIITSIVLISSSVAVIINSIGKIYNPQNIKYNEMIVFALIGLVVNLVGLRLTHGGHSVNQKVVNLHMLEDVLGWLAVLIGAIVMKFTNLAIIDPVISVTVAVFILIHSIKHILKAVSIILEKAPDEINLQELKKELLKIEDISEVKELHLWSIDENSMCATVCVTANKPQEVKNQIGIFFSERRIKVIAIEIN